MKQYKKTFEDIFSIDNDQVKNKLNLDKISIGHMEVNEYISLFRNFLKSFYSDLFDNCVRLSWLRRNFSYYGKKTVLPMQKNSLLLNIAFVKLLRRYIGMDIQIMTRSKFFNKLELYFDDFFPDFCEGNPFTNPNYYKFPFKHISIDFLMVVYQLDDRMMLLKEAESKKMTYAIFVDYVINHVYSINEELGRYRYQIKQTQDRNFPFYIRDMDKQLQAKKGKKRTCLN